MLMPLASESRDSNDFRFKSVSGSGLGSQSLSNTGHLVFVVSDVGAYASSLDTVPTHWRLGCIGPTYCYTVGGTVQLALMDCTIAATTPGLRHYQ